MIENGQFVKFIILNFARFSTCMLPVRVVW